MRPCIEVSALREEESFSRSRRGQCTAAQRRTLNGSLNLFATPPPSPPPQPIRRQSQQQRQPQGAQPPCEQKPPTVPSPDGSAAEQPPSPAGQASAASHTSSARRRRYDPNVESRTTREFPSACLRRVSQPRHVETPRGVRHVADAVAARQNIQVVNVSPAYLDPNQLAAPHSYVRWMPEKRSSAEVGQALRYGSQASCAGPNEPGGAERCSTASHVGSGVPDRVSQSRTTPRRTLDYTRTERFWQSVCDHAQQRARGVTEFYVQLVRDMVGGLTASTPRPQLQPWTLDQRHARPVLTLRRCRDQLVALTSIPVTLRELAQMLWGSAVPCHTQATPEPKPSAERTPRARSQSEIEVLIDNDDEEVEGEEDEAAPDSHSHATPERGSEHDESAVAGQEGSSQSASARSESDGDAEGEKDAQELADLPVLFKDFAAAFGDAPGSNRLAVMKI